MFDESSGICRRRPEGLGVATFTGQFDRVLHVLLHGRERREVTLEDLGRLGHRDVEALRKPVGLHAVGKTVRDHLGFRAFLDMNIIWCDVEDTCSGRGVDVVARFERFDETRILGEVGDAPEFDLVVVRDQEFVARRGHERGAEDAPPLGAHGNVVQVRLIR